MNAPPRPAYRLGRQFVMRMAGFPAEWLERTASPELTALLDRLLDAEERLDRAGRALLGRLIGAPEVAGRERKRIARGEAVDLPPRWSTTAEAAAFAAAREAQRRALGALEAGYPAAIESARRQLHDLVADPRFREVLLLSVPSLFRRAPREAGQPLPQRNSDARHQEHTWMSYLQRIVTKNDTISFFGPTAWGRVDPSAPEAIAGRLEEGLAERAVFVEHWVCTGLAARVEADPGAREFLRPELCDDVVLEATGAVRVGSGEAVVLSTAERELAGRCSAGRRVRELGAIAEIESLVQKKVLTLELRVPYSAKPIAFLRREISGWPECAERTRYLAAVDELEALRGRFEAASSLEARRTVLERLEALLGELGVSTQRASRGLYASRMPLSEDCRRRTGPLVLGGALAEQATARLEAFYALWRDLAALFAHRASRSLRAVHQAFGRPRVPLPAFLAACARQELPYLLHSGCGMNVELDAEIQEAWSKQLGERWTQAQVDLTEADLGFIRERFSPPPMKAFDSPAPDFQIAARSEEAIRRGDFQLVLGEIHPDFSPWAQCFFAFCPDVPSLVEDYRSRCHPPGFMIGGAWDGMVHTLNRAPELTGGWTSAGSARAEGVRHLRSAEVAVEMTEDDLVAVDAEGRVLGSLLYHWPMAFNTHRLELLGTGSHSPRLRVGGVVVQRESWVVESDELLDAALKRVGPRALLALRGLRRRLGLPEEVFVRPVLPIRLLQHKDSKPVFADFRNPFLLEILASTFRGYRRVRVAEAFPASQDFWLRDADGRYSCELRTVLTSAGFPV
jgi:hypothetical protein